MKAAPRIFARGAALRAAPPPVRWFICGAGRPDAPARTATRPHLHPPSLVPPFLPHPRPHRAHGATPHDRPDAPLARLSPTPSVSRPAAHPSQGSSVPPATYTSSAPAVTPAPAAHTPPCPLVHPMRRVACHRRSPRALIARTRTPPHLRPPAPTVPCPAAAHLPFLPCPPWRIRRNFRRSAYNAKESADHIL